MRTQLFRSRMPPPAGRAAISGSTLAVLDCFLALGLLGLYLKLGLLGPQWEAIARFLGKDDGSALTFAERLGFFFNDIVVHLLLIPLAATVVLVTLFRGIRLAAAVAVTLVSIVFYFIELRAHAEVGQYISGDVLGDLAGWAFSNPALTGEYLTPASLMKLAALVGAVVAIAAAGWYADRAHARWRRPVRLALVGMAGVVMGAALVLAPVSYANGLEGSSLNQSAVGRAIATLAGGADAAANVPSLDAALHASATLTRTAAFDPSHPLVGGERGSDVIVFMMETGPADALDFAIDGRDLPGTGPLFDRAFVARRHYTTHPYSSDAVYSVLSGLYPQGRRRLLRGLEAGDALGLMSALRERMPMRRVYLPSLYNIENDDEMYLGFGADSVYASDHQPSDEFASRGSERADVLLGQLEAHGGRFAPQLRSRLQSRLRADLQALERMKSDIRGAVAAGSRYWAMYFPEIGHGPWPALNGESSNLERGRSLMQLQDLWLKEIVDLLREVGRLDRTVIAITADHGPRTRVEEPDLPVGRISEYTFRVPLLIYAPRTLAATTPIDVPTSHVDVSPTLLALLGETEPISRMQGIPLWQRSGEGRVYVLGAAYGGADGYTQSGTFYMRQALSGAVYRSRTFAFDDSAQVRPGDPDIEMVEAALDDLNALQQALVVHALDQPSGR